MNAIRVRALALAGLVIAGCSRAPADLTTPDHSIMMGEAEVLGGGSTMLGPTRDFVDAMLRVVPADRLLAFAYTADLYSQWEQCGCSQVRDGGGLPRMGSVLGECREWAEKSIPLVVAGNCFALRGPEAIVSLEGAGAVVALKHEAMASALRALGGSVYILSDDDVRTATVLGGYTPRWLDALGTVVVRSDRDLGPGAPWNAVRSTATIRAGDQDLHITGFDDLHDRMIARRADLGIPENDPLLLVFTGEGTDRLNAVVAALHPDLVLANRIAPGAVSGAAQASLVGAGGGELGLTAFAVPGGGRPARERGDEFLVRYCDPFESWAVLAP